MKKYVTGVLAVILAVSASAFTKATETKDGQYFLNPETGMIELITTPGDCLEGENFCKYHLVEGQPNDGDPLHYEGEGAQLKQWVPRQTN